MGAVYLDGGHAAAHDFVVRLVGDRLESLGGTATYSDHKTILQELAARRAGAIPVYVVDDEGPDHAKHFTATVAIAGEVLGAGEGPTKKQAEQRAAREAVARLTAGD